MVSAGHLSVLRGIIIPPAPQSESRGLPHIGRWAKTAGKPILITEWYAKGADSGVTNEDGSGFLVRSQRDGARFYQNFALKLLANPDCVGWHWFKYRDSPVCNAGVVDGKDEPYARLLGAMKEINDRAYPLAEWLRKR